MEAINLDQTKAADGSVREVFVVEGLKDALAVRTSGRLAYALPGAGQPIPRPVAVAMAKFRVVLALDGDDAGEMGNQAIYELLDHHGFDVRIEPLPEGKDHADLLAESLQMS